MTIIVAVRKHRSIAIAGDRQFNHQRDLVPGSMLVHPGKIHRLGDAYVGVSGSMTHHNVLGSVYAKNPELFSFASVGDIFETFRQIQPKLRDEYYLMPKEDDPEQAFETNHMEGLVISSTGLFSFCGYGQVAEYNSFWAVGSGTDYALGVLEATYSLRRGAKELAVTAAEVACKFNSYCGLPIDCFETCAGNLTRRHRK
jgi:ATP-dependent protease HslVU (ClpYQ) peptidase subunit